jgi:hypothetical protein
VFADGVTASKIVDADQIEGTALGEGGEIAVDQHHRDPGVV